eukprot:scaffold13394_cov147-Isochrysis_galbana.AAC.1
MNEDGKRRHVEHNVCKSYEQVPVPTGHHGMKMRGAPILAASGLAGRIDVHMAFHAKSSSSETGIPSGLSSSVSSSGVPESPSRSCAHACQCRDDPLPRAPAGHYLPCWRSSWWRLV